MNIDTTGIQELIMTILNGIINFDLKAIDLDYLGVVLTEVAPILNPIWAAITDMLGEYIGL
ncbi:MAG: hypothetical protein IJ264_04825 [Clostridia bacterium]|nr:hypothetical protein [Clostridia bacterium]